TNEIRAVKRVYRLRNGLVIDKYNNHYGYWYMVRQGDSLYGISRQYGINIRLLASVNGLTASSYLKYKAFLFIPLTESYLQRYGEVIEVKLRKGHFIWPVYSRISSGFGLRQWGWRKKFHAGIDLAAPVGTKIMAAAEGTVVSATYSSGYGYVIKIEHENYFHTLYAHLEKILVKQGDTVQQSQVIGLVGKTGRSTGYHLHFEIRIKDYPVNPVDYLPEGIEEVSELYNTDFMRSIQ
ncbi:MAG: peptidoglycan DD-metalloendopeptidase family protein, partial [bacterium]|nr:peptidoglycan DD-metalloendopeptidase family protein [bacterium]